MTVKSQIETLSHVTKLSLRDIEGPMSSTDNAIARWDGVLGDHLQDSGVLIDDSGNITGATSLNVGNILLSGNTIVTDQSSLTLDVDNAGASLLYLKNTTGGAGSFDCLVLGALGVSTTLAVTSTSTLSDDVTLSTANLKIADGYGILDENGLEQLLFTTTASAVNHIQITNAATGDATEGPGIAAVGDDTNIALLLHSKGTGEVSFGPVTDPVTWKPVTGTMHFPGDVTWEISGTSLHRIVGFDLPCPGLGVYTIKNSGAGTVRATIEGDLIVEGSVITAPLSGVSIAITPDTNGDVELTPSGTGLTVITAPSVAVDGWTDAAHDHSDAAHGGVLETSITLTTPTIGDFTNATHDHADAAGGGELQIIKDQTPQLYADLDTDGNNIIIDDAHGILDDSSNFLLKFSKAASAVDYLQIGNSATGAPGYIDITATGSDTDVDMRFYVRDGGVDYRSLWLTNGGLNKLYRNLTVYRHDDAAASAGGLWGKRSRGTEDVPTVVVDGDRVFVFLGQAYTSTQYLAPGRLLCQVDGTPGPGSMPLAWDFRTGTASTGSSRFTIASDGVIDVVSTNPMQFNGANNYIVGSDANVMQYRAGTSHSWWMATALEMYLNANILTFETGGTDPSLDWGTADNFHIKWGVNNTITINTLGVGFNGQAAAVPPDYTVSNKTLDRILDCNGDTLAQVADVLGSLIDDLIAIGLLQ